MVFPGSRAAKQCPIRECRPAEGRLGDCRQPIAESYARVPRIAFRRLSPHALE